jgi:pimeloyl-ACP methyl ester carboxylesterase
MAAYLESLPESARTALQMPIQAETPSIVLSASNASEAELEERDSWVRESKFGRHIRIDGGGHWLQLERPTIVIEAIQELVWKARHEKRAPEVR